MTTNHRSLDLGFAFGGSEVVLELLDDGVAFVDLYRARGETFFRLGCASARLFPRRRERYFVLLRGIQARFQQCNDFFFIAKLFFKPLDA